jgi:hypothetical protein
MSKRTRILQNIHRRKNRCMTRHFVLEHHFIKSKIDLSVDQFITSLDAKFAFYLYSDFIDVWKISVKKNIFSQIDYDDDNIVVKLGDKIITPIDKSKIPVGMVEKNIVYFGKLVYIDKDDNISDVKQNISGIIFGRNIFAYIHNGDNGGYIVKKFKHNHSWKNK